MKRRSKIKDVKYKGLLADLEGLISVTVTSSSLALGWTLSCYSQLPCFELFRKSNSRCFYYFLHLLTDRLTESETKLKPYHSCKLNTGLFSSYLSSLCLQAGCHVKFLSIHKQQKIKKKNEEEEKNFWEHSATDHRSKYFVVKALLLSTIPSFHSPPPVLFMILLLKKLMTLYLWQPYHFIEIFMSSFFLLKGKILKWSPSCLFVLFPKGKSMCLFPMCVARLPQLSFLFRKLQLAISDGNSAA